MARNVRMWLEVAENALLWSEIVNSEMEIGYMEIKIGLEIGWRWRLEIEDWRLEIGDWRWRLEIDIRDWRWRLEMEIRDWRLDMEIGD